MCRIMCEIVCIMHDISPVPSCCCEDNSRKHNEGLHVVVNYKSPCHVIVSFSHYEQIINTFVNSSVLLKSAFPQGLKSYVRD